MCSKKSWQVSRVHRRLSSNRMEKNKIRSKLFCVRHNINWFDITGQDERLREIGIDPQKALRELHVENEDRQILVEIDAYILLLRKVPLLRPLAWLIGLPVIRPMLSKIYRRQVDDRLEHRVRR